VRAAGTLDFRQRKQVEGDARVGSRQREDGRAGWKRGKELAGLNQSREREQRGEETKGRGNECEGTGRERKRVRERRDLTGINCEFNEEREKIVLGIFCGGLV
jgi:hypothetical protein